MNSSSQCYARLAAVIFLAGGAAVQPLRAESTPGGDGMNAPQVIGNDIAPDIALARETLLKAGIDATGLPVQSARAVTWSDSSLGCGKPQAMSLQVLTRGCDIEETRSIFLR